jgi:integrase
MILLGINGGFGNTDCARLPVSAMDLEQGVIEFERPKTGLERAVPLWPETAAALQRVLESRPVAQGPGDLVFVMPSGKPWVRQNVHRDDEGNIEKVVPMDRVHQGFDKLQRRLGIRRKRRGFYALRHTFRTWADETRDQHAIHRIMGHAIPGMSGIYVEEISLERLRAVVDHIRSKVFPEKRENQEAEKGTAANPT